MPAKLVVIGDSLSQGFQSASIFNTRFSYPAMIASALSENDFRVPDFSGEGGLPINLEQLFRLLASRYGPDINFLEIPFALGTVNSFLDRVEDYWERGAGMRPSSSGPLHHNLAVWGFSVGDVDTLTEGLCRRVIPPARDDLPLLRQIVEWPMYRTARRTLNPSFSSSYENFNQLDVAQTIADTNGGIENLIVWLGANNCLGTVTTLKIQWSEDNDFDRLAYERSCNLWRPEHFQILYTRVAERIELIGADNVFVATVPHVTIPPVSRGISPGAPAGQERDADGYYQFYTHFWIWDADFARAPHNYPKLTGSEARIIDGVVDEYNAIIRAEAAARGWHVVDLCKVLDELAFRRQGGNPVYQFPIELVDALKRNYHTKNRFDATGRPILDTRFLRRTRKPDGSSDYQGGLVSLDGIHPTTIGYGITAHEFLKIMGDFVPVQALDWDSIIQADTLVRRLPDNLENLRQILGFVFSLTGMQGMIHQLGTGMANLPT
jgi:hypothetical protein